MISLRTLPGSSLPLDANGYTDFSGVTPDKRIYYSSSGSDTSPGNGTVATPYKTIARAYADIVDGQCTFVMAKCGDTWTGTDAMISYPGNPYNSGFMDKGGASPSRPLLFTNYDPANPLVPNPGTGGARPLFRTSTTNNAGWGYGCPTIMMQNNSYNPTNVAITGLEFYAYKADFYNNPSEFDMNDVNSLARYPIQTYSPKTQWLLIEDCKFGYYFYCIDLDKASPQSGYLIMRRNIFADNWCAGHYNSGGYLSYWANVLVEDNVFDMTSQLFDKSTWTSIDETDLGVTFSLASGSGSAIVATITNTTFRPLIADWNTVAFRNNGDTLPPGLSFGDNATLYYYMRNSNAAAGTFQLTDNPNQASPSAPITSTGVGSGTHALRFCSGGDGNTQGQSHPLYMQATNSNCTFQQNVVMNTTYSMVLRPDHSRCLNNLFIAVPHALSGGNDQAGSAGTGYDYIVQNNVCTEGVRMDFDRTGFPYGFEMTYLSGSGVQLKNNIVANGVATSSPGSGYHLSNTTDHIVVNGNILYNFYGQSSINDQGVSNVLTGALISGPFPHPDYKIADYMTAQGQTASLKQFATNCRAMRKGAFDTRWYAPAVNDWFRATAFGQPTIGLPTWGGGSVPAATTMPVVTGSTSVGSVLTSSTGTWTNGPTGYAYQWRRDGSIIGGATASTYTIVSGDSGHSLSCSVTASNASGSGSPAISNSVTVGSGPPPQTYHTVSLQVS